MHLDPARLITLATKSRSFYKRFSIPKKSGGVRVIYHPSRELKAIQRWILHGILNNLAPSDSATAFSIKKGLIHNVEPHSLNRYFICIDLEDFFPSISHYRVRRVFKTLGYSQDVASFLTELCTCNGGLPQGAVTSPSISNLVASKLDRRLQGLLSRRNITYTRYADDLTFSSNNRNALVRVMPIVRDIIEDEEFRINDSKTRFMGPRAQCRVTGLVKNCTEPKFGIGRKTKRKMRAILHKIIVRGSPCVEYPSTRSISGWFSYCKSVDYNSYKQLSQYHFRLVAGAEGSGTAESAHN
mgnify:CR=1 FL=1